MTSPEAQTAARLEDLHPTPPEVTDRSVTFHLPDPDRALSTVKLLQEVQRPREGPDFNFDEATSLWKLEFPRPDADRIEYMFKLIHKAGHDEVINDPGNPSHAPGPFGSKSVIEFPGYEAPAWSATDRPIEGHVVETHLKSRTLRDKLHTFIWTAPGHEHDEPLPLLVAHDGPEYSELSSLLLFLEKMREADRIPPMRAALIAPVSRDEIYSASAAYARAFAYEVMPQIEKLAPMPHGRSQRIGMGASLGALSMLHIHRHNPATFGALYLQSGSYFRQRYDKQESGFARFRRISRFMGKVLTAEGWLHPIPVTMTCGTIEENLANNRATQQALHRQAYDARLIENRDGHNWVGWRDTFDPYLAELLARMWA